MVWPGEGGADERAASIPRKMGEHVDCEAFCGERWLLGRLFCDAGHEMSKNMTREHVFWC